MYLCTGRKIWTSFSCLVLLKCYHVAFSQFKFPANLVQLVVPKMHCLCANAVVQPSVQHCPCYMAWKTKVHTCCRHCHLCINAPMRREKRWLQGLFDPPSYLEDFSQNSDFQCCRVASTSPTLWLWWRTLLLSKVVPPFFFHQNDLKGCERDYLDALGHFL